MMQVVGIIHNKFQTNKIGDEHDGSMAVIAHPDFILFYFLYLDKCLNDGVHETKRNLQVSHYEDGRMALVWYHVEQGSC